MDMAEQLIQEPFEVDVGANGVAIQELDYHRIEQRSSLVGTILHMDF